VQTLEGCFRSRSVPSASTFNARLEAKEGPLRACWNSWSAPHHVEGYFPKFSDMLARAGDVRNAK
jgi:hypothetical protein